MSPFDPAGVRGKIEELTKRSEQPGFWDDNEAARKVMLEKSRLEGKLERFHDLEEGYEDLEVMIDLAEEEGAAPGTPEGDSIAADATEQYEKTRKMAEDFTIEILLTGEYDKNNAILTVHAGAGGTDAQEWTGRLLRMYTRWGESKGFRVRTVDIQDNEEGGISRATIVVEGENAYGYLKTEKGVHRLVRISPFDSSGRRHTSFAAVEVMPEIDEDTDVEIDPADIRIDTFRSSGKGGQKVNKTDSAIRITHIPTNIVVSCQNERSQFQNKDMAMRILKSRLMELKEQEHKENLKELHGDYSQITWGSQIRSYVFQPYTLVKDHRTGAESGNVEKVLDGDIDEFIYAKLRQKDQ